MFVQVKLSQGLRLQYNWKEFRLYLQLEEQWRDNTLGLCGTFNGNIQDDFLWVSIYFLLSSLSLSVLAYIQLASQFGSCAIAVLPLA